jgi:hypothetical protein
MHAPAALNQCMIACRRQARWSPTPELPAVMMREYIERRAMTHPTVKAQWEPRQSQVEVTRGNARYSWA